MSLDKSFDPRVVEQRWYRRWEQAGWFAAGADPGAPSFCIQLPPPNVTGTLHMGHAFNQTLMDALTRYHRMRGENTLWLPGTDHAGIATQIVVERQLEQAGSSRQQLGREKFIDKVWEWKRQSGSTITEQMRRLGDSCDWSARVLHHGRQALARGDRDIRAPVRAGPDLPRQAPGQLGPGAAHRGVRPRGRKRGRGRASVAHPLSRRGLRR